MERRALGRDADRRERLEVSLEVGAEAVERALRWLAAHQDDTGGWDSAGFMKHDRADDRCDGKGAATFDVGVTGLATLAFLGAGYNDRGSAAENPHAKNVRNALRFLMSAQGEDGNFMPAEAPRSLLGNAIATLALAEAFAKTRNPRYKRPAEQGVAFLLKQQTAGAAWGEPALTAWCVSALASARGAGIDVPERALADALAWVESATDKGTGRVGPEAKTEAATAAGLLTRMLCGQGPLAVETIPKGAKLCAAKPPAWNAEEGTIDMDYWLWGTLALFQVGPDPWRDWSAALKTAILDRQQAAGSRAGSWDPVGVEGGRIHATALMALNLEVYYRYARAR
ncbi:MAG: prenyltransferase/squalene oxidase repeat-containing protein [Planctomycetota bacterium]